MKFKQFAYAGFLAFAGLTFLAPTIASASPERHKVCHWDRHHHHRSCHWVR